MEGPRFRFSSSIVVDDMTSYSVGNSIRKSAMTWPLTKILGRKSIW